MLELVGLFILMVLSIIICCNWNPMYSIFSFISLIVLLSTYLIKHDVEFIAIAFLIIYIGAIMVIFLFVIFLLNLYQPLKYNRILSNLFSDKLLITRSALFVLLIIKILLILKSLSLEIKSFIMCFPPDVFYNYQEICLFAEIKLNLLYAYDINIIGHLLYTQYAIYLIVCGLVLFVALLGSALLVRTSGSDKNTK